MELSGPGVQYIADNQLYNSIITAHAILMIFFMVEKFNVFNFGLCPQSYFTYYSSLTGGRGSFCVEKENIVKISNDNNKEVFIGNNKNQDKKNSNDSKHKYIKVLVNDPFNNRDIILKVTKKPSHQHYVRWYGVASLQKGVSSLTPNNLNPQWVTGFSDAESCFGFRVRKNLKLKVGWEVIPYFFINLHVKDLSILLEIKEFFGVGSISSNKELALYQVNSLKDLVNVIIPHFELYPLLTKKKADFWLFKLAIELIKEKQHRKIEGIHKLLSIKASLNRGLLNDELTSFFNNVVPQERIEVPLPEVINPYWFAGFTSGDGSFSVEILKSSSHKIGHQVILKFLITQHSAFGGMLNYWNVLSNI